MAVKNYDPKRIAVVILGVQIQGFAPDTFVEVSRDTDTVTDDVGSQGDVVRIISRDNRGTIKITLQQSSPSNDYLSALVAADELVVGGSSTVGPSGVFDLNGTTQCDAQESWVKKPADVKFGSKPDTTVWEVRCAKLNMRVGGSTV